MGGGLGGGCTIVLARFNAGTDNIRGELVGCVGGGLGVGGVLGFWFLGVLGGWGGGLGGGGWGGGVGGFWVGFGWGWGV